MQLPIASASLIVRTFNEGRYLDRALSAARESGPLLKEIVVVDSGSTDNTLAIAQWHGAKIFLIEKAEFSFGRSLNLGCVGAKGEVTVFLSGHCIPIGSDWLENLLKPFADARVAAVYGRQIGGEGTKYSEARVFEKYYPMDQPSQGEAFCNNANAAVRRAIWNRFKFDEELTGLEDIDMGKKIVGAGFRIAYAPSAVVAHLHHESWPQIKRRYEREAIALRHIHPTVHLSLIEAASCFAAACVFDFGHALKEKKFWSKLREIILYRLHQFWGSWLGSCSHRELSTREKAVYFFPLSK
jgi:rhamnosyltransferase